MRDALRLIACWALIVVGVPATLLFGLEVIYGETSGARGGAIVLIAISLALVAGGVFGLRRQRRPPEEPTRRRRAGLVREPGAGSEGAREQGLPAVEGPHRGA